MRCRLRSKRCLFMVILIVTMVNVVMYTTWMISYVTKKPHTRIEVTTKMVIITENLPIPTNNINVLRPLSNSNNNNNNNKINVSRPLSNNNNNMEKPRYNLWRKLSPNTSVYSAYYDDRDIHSKPQISVLGFTKEPLSSINYFCQFYYKNNPSCEIKPSKLSLLAKDHWLGRDGKPFYHPISLSCPLTSNEIPVSVAVSSTRECPTKEAMNILPILNRKGIEKYTFVVCVGSPVHGTLNIQDFVSHFELNRLLGAEFFTVYINDIQPKFAQVLQKYVEEGLAEVVSNWANGLPNPVHYFGQFLSINDCLYKNIYRAKYLVYADLDEIIMPLRHPNWASLMNDIADKPKQGAFLFENTFLYSSQDSSKHLCSNNQGNSISLPRFMTFGERSPVIMGSKPRRTKYITKTAVTLVTQIHKVAALARGYVVGFVDSNTALSYHYRLPYKKKVKKEERIKDIIMEKYHWKHLEKLIRDRLCV